MKHQDFDAYRNSSFDRKIMRKKIFQLSLTRDTPPPTENLYGERRKGSSAIARVVFIIILLHIVLVGGTCVYKKLGEADEPAVVSTQAPPPAPVVTKTPLPTAISTSQSTTPSLPSMLDPVPTLPAANTSTSESNIHITTEPAPVVDEVAAVELPEEEPQATKPTFTGSSSYTIQSGDLWSTICKKHGVDSKVLQAANPQVKDINKIVVGMVLNIPTKGGATPTAKPVVTTKPVETAKPASTSGAKIHTVVSGDRLSKIAEKYGTSVAKLCELNNIKVEDAGKIRIGQKIKLP